MYKVKQLYVDVSDYDGHTFLIKIEDIVAFERELEQLQNRLYSAFSVYDEDDYYSDFENLLEHFDAQKLEGERVYIVLEEDLVKGEED